MAARTPSVETLYAGQMMANQLLFKLMLSMATNFVFTEPEERTTASGEIVRSTLEAFALAATVDENALGLKRGSYDADAAHQMALNALGEALSTIRTRVLRMKE